MYKRIIAFLVIGILCFQSAYSQDESDALRYSFLGVGGTARMQASGGAGVSLGGEAGGIDLNPAGLGLFKTSDFSITPGLKSVSNTGDYLDGTGSDSKTNFYIQQMALVIASGNQNRKKTNSKWKNVTFGIGLNRLANFNQNIFYTGNNKNSSYADNYLITLANGGYTESQADENDLSKNHPYGLSQAYLTGLVGPAENNSGQFDHWESLPGNVLADGYSLQQSNTISTKGGLDEFSLAVAGNYNDRLFIGAGLNVPSISFDRTQSFRETNSSDKDAYLNYYEVTDRLHTDGTGVNGKIGIIYKIASNIRAGAAFYTPTVFSMHDTYTTNMVTNTTDQGMFTSNTKDITDGYPGEYDYSMTTPWRVTGGLSFILGANAEATKHGFLSLDYAYVNYAAARFHYNSSNSTASDKAMADALNKSISNMYQGASNVRLGGEMKFNIFSVRAGIAYMGSPYSDADIKGDQMQYSLGLGIRNRGFYADLAYVYTSKGDRTNQPYLVTQPNSLNIQSPAPAIIKGNISNVLLTFGFVL